jgi:hypothetical protein
MGNIYMPRKLKLKKNRTKKGGRENKTKKRGRENRTKKGGGEWVKPWTWFKSNDSTTTPEPPNNQPIPNNQPSIWMRLKSFFVSRQALETNNGSTDGAKKEDGAALGEPNKEDGAALEEPNKEDGAALEEPNKEDGAALEEPVSASVTEEPQKPENAATSKTGGKKSRKNRGKKSKKSQKRKYYK